MVPRENSLWKYHALGNDYLIADPANTDIEINANSVRLLCNRKTGIGADGLLWGPFFQEKALSLKVFNADGSTCNRSGNGLRIFAHYLYKQGYVSEVEFELTCGTNSSPIKVMDLEASIVSAGLGVFRPFGGRSDNGFISQNITENSITVDGDQLSIYCVTNGTPHCIVFCEKYKSSDIDRLGFEISSNKLFKHGINVTNVKRTSRTLIQTDFWESGAGVVLASGSAAAAAAYVAFHLGLIDTNLKVEMQAGILDVSIDCAGQTHISGRVESVMQCTLAGEFVTQLKAVNI